MTKAITNELKSLARKITQSAQQKKIIPLHAPSEALEPRQHQSEPQPPGIKKEYLKRKDRCRVTFRLPKAAVSNGKCVYIVGDFNDWDPRADQMKKSRNGDYTIKIELEPDREYQFRYLIDSCVWENDWQADNYVRNPYGDSENSVVIV